MTGPFATARVEAPEPGVATLELRKLDKKFAGTHALKAVSLSFMPGEVHAIVGENGAGKSTLIKLLTGVYPKTSGSILWQGREVEFSGPQDALVLGINAVHQEVVLCPHLTVAANIFLGDETTRFGLLRKREMTRRAQAILDELGFHLPADAMLSDLTIGQQQLVATARAASRGTRFLVFDEPTGYLTRAETDQLFALIRRLHGQGVTIIYISHRMEEIFQIADRVSVLRDGQLIGTHVVAETNERDLIREMVNRPLDQVHHKEVIPLGDTLLEVRNMSGPGFEDVSLTVRRGEIVGLYGLIGAGRSEFVQCLFGRTRKTAGDVKLKGKAVEFRREADAIDSGIVLLPESRRDQGLCLNLPVGFNLNLPVFHKISTGGLIRSGEEKTRSDKQMRDLRIVAASRNVDALTLSGGNQQKIVIGKWLNHGADLFIFDEPTVGVDVGTKAEIYKLMAILLRNGAGIILISSYLPEVYDLGDTLHVFRKGRLAATFGHRKVDHETILAEAIGT
ncbi:ABC transporter ATP-binding protein [Skermanella aerolata]|uniref:ABC transporter ATP-binding protein n=1 Tax=Skermanella aerolata TaxID=393310 RepID=A0A512DHG1_9PROT|nr:sugar ABC transporter ATP-binding protein [Skermanella aerolata]KJB94062.1 ABC transporter ATP-binding protein [Skermanella aerolata KACC 11604]GEO35919.1 ABC transporter ATP-binding protein [Skermanella aerolata]